VQRSVVQRLCFDCMHVHSAHCEAMYVLTMNVTVPPQAQAALQDIELGAAAVAGDEWDGLPYRVDMDERGEVMYYYYIFTWLSIIIQVIN
jgi:hypothetical protein